MSDSANSTNAFTPSADIYKGISVLSSEDWIGLTTFFESAVTDNPTTTELMRAMLGMQKQDAFRPEFSEAVELFVTLKGVGQKFKADVQDKMLTLADDIVQYNDVAATTYERLIELVDRFDLEERLPHRRSRRWKRNGRHWSRFGKAIRPAGGRSRSSAISAARWSS
ncbi:hypothetical protein ACHFCA_14175 [Delftia tsuruhatensis]